MKKCSNAVLMSRQEDHSSVMQTSTRSESCVAISSDSQGSPTSRVRKRFATALPQRTTSPMRLFRNRSKKSSADGPSYSDTKVAYTRGNRSRDWWTWRRRLRTPSVSGVQSVLYSSASVWTMNSGLSSTRSTVPLDWTNEVKVCMPSKVPTSSLYRSYPTGSPRSIFSGTPSVAEYRRSGTYFFGVKRRLESRLQDPEQSNLHNQNAADKYWM